jgi:hypothetical protein
MLVQDLLSFALLIRRWVAGATFAVQEGGLYAKD